MPKTYIVAPNFSIVPTALCLGDVIETPLSPELVPLNRLERLDIPPQDLYEVDKKNAFGLTRKALLSGRFGIWAQLLGFLGLPISMDAGLFVERNSTDIINVETLETHEFIATDHYIQDVVARGSVQAFLEASEYKAKLFMVTGLKIARNASLNQEASRNAEVAFGPSTEGLGIDLKPALEFLAQRTNGMSFKSSTDFILAFRVREIRVKIDPATKELTTKHSLSVKGATMLGDEPNIRTPEISSINLGEELRPSDFGPQAEFGADEQEAWVIPDMADE